MRRRGHSPEDAPCVKGRCRTRGQSLVELALGLPLLTLVMLGTIDLGRVFFDYINLRGASAEGATYAARNPTDTSGIVTAVTGSGVPSGTNVSVILAGSCATPGGTGTVTVDVTSVFRPLSLAYFARFGLNTWNLHSSSTSRCLT